jgi:NADPH-dependent 2,4-dienoyl-CoA reductase/sulfur reductase-like enzyme
VKKMESYELIVIGGGPAGITLAKKLGSKMNMAVIRPEDYSMIYCAMPYVIEELIPIEKTFKKDELVADSETGIIIGGQIVSGEPVTGKIDLLTYAIQNRSTIKDLAKLSYSAQPFQSFFPAANAIVLAAEDILNKI